MPGISRAVQPSPVPGSAYPKWCNIFARDKRIILWNAWAQDRHPYTSEIDHDFAAKIALVSTQVVNDINQRYDQLRAGLDRSICQIQAGNAPDPENFSSDPHQHEKQQLVRAMQRYTIACHWREEMGEPWREDEYER